MRTLILVAMLAGCGGMKQIDDDALVMVQPQAVDTLREKRQAVEEARTHLDVTEDRNRRARQEVSRLESSVADLDDEIKRQRKAKLKAVKTTETERVEESHDALAETRQERFELTQELKSKQNVASLADARMRLAREKLELARAELYEAEAEAAAAGGAQVDVAAYEAQRKEAAADVASARKAVQEAESGDTRSASR